MPRAAAAERSSAAARVALDSRRVLELERVQLDLAGRREAAELAGDLLPRLEPRLVVGRAQVDAERHAAGDDVGRAGLDDELADGRDDALAPARDRVDGCTTRAATTSGSWRSVIGTVPAWPASPRSSSRARVRPGDRGDDAELQILRLEDRALLDVQLDVAEQVGCGAGLQAIASGRPPTARSASPSAMPSASTRSRSPGGSCRRRRGCRGRACRSAGPPRRRSRSPRARTAALAARQRAASATPASTPSGPS